MKLTNGKMDGFDVAVYQKNLDITNTPGGFVFVKATQGTWYQSPTFVSQYKAAVDSGKLVGIYHYSEGSDYVKEVDFYLSVVGDRLGNAVLALDEEGTSNPIFGTSKMVSYVTNWMREVYKRTGIKPILYMSKSVFRSYDWSALKNEGYKIWVAQYASNDTTGYQSEPWTDDKGWGAFDISDVAIYQYSSKGRIGNYNANLDLDKAFVDKDEWMAMAGLKKPTEAENEPVSTIPEKQYIRIDPQTAVINLLLAELGYQEKKSNAWLDRKHTNAGGNNWTKYARDMHKVYPATMDNNPIPWCDAFCDWIMYKLFGVSTARSLIGQYDDYTVASANQYIKMGGWVTHDFEPGDQVFFSNNDKVSGIYHTGFFWKYEDGKTYTIEGNTSGSNSGSVIADGGSVCIRSYPRVPNKIVGAGRPKWDLVGDILVECPEYHALAKNASGAAVRAVQTVVGAKVDGNFGPATEYAVKTFQMKHGISDTGVVGDTTWPVILSKVMISTGFPELEIGSQGPAVRFLQAVIGANADGVFGNMTQVSLKKWQKCHNLAADGICGAKTWEAVKGELK